MQDDIHIPERMWNVTAASIMLDGIIDDLEIAVEYLEKHQAAYTDENCVSLFGSQEWQRIAVTVSPPIPIRNFGDVQAWMENNYQGNIPGRDHITIAEAIADFKTALAYFKNTRETGTYNEDEIQEIYECQEFCRILTTIIELENLHT
ncbi:hypothetical protein F4009_08530 [Candidatus Poribacteria bacterium]|nr:hypothetical protein [Candidatus Poribacteria bacterium]MYH82914.1 hypothetical protein [Candidatus Poribacteria bacterium]MYK94027.1 hypothetical protein [Candidatus Poribacteria bacterium]